MRLTIGDYPLLHALNVHHCDCMRIFLLILSSSLNTGRRNVLKVLNLSIQRLVWLSQNDSQ